jgi:hypothetical protein
MRSITILILCCSSLVLANSKLEDSVKDIIPRLIKSNLQTTFAQNFVRSYLPFIVEIFRENRQGVGATFAASDLGAKAKVPVIPPIPDPLRVPDGDYVFKPEFGLIGDLSLWHQWIEGMSGLKDSFEIKGACGEAVAIGTAFTVFLPFFKLGGDYKTNLTIDGIHAMIGNGQFHLGASNSSANLEMTVGLRNGTIDEFYVHQINLDLSFPKWDFYFENFVLDGFPLEDKHWSNLSENLRQTFTHIWPTIKKDISEAIRHEINGVIKNCRIKNFISYYLGLSDLCCINLP